VTGVTFILAQDVKADHVRLFRRSLPRPPVTATARELRANAVQRSRRAWRHVAVMLPLLAAVVAVHRYRVELFGLDEPIRLATAAVIVIIGWAFARQLGAALAGRFEARMDAGTAAVTGFAIRLVAIVAMVLVALRLAGLDLRTLAFGASFGAIVLGLAAQQTFGNIVAGIVLLSARPFSAGDRVRFSGFGMDVEGDVVSHGLLYITCRDGADLVLVPNATALTMSVRPLREPAAVELRARLPQDVDPQAVQDRLVEDITIGTKATPDVALEAVDEDDVVVRIRAVPQDRADGAALTREVLRSVNALRAA
jgi:small-conductance mechanosensitive channel